MYSCPRCHRVTSAMSLVRHCRGLTEFSPEQMCATCLGELRAEEAGTPTLETAWGVTVLHEREAAEPVALAA